MRRDPIEEQFSVLRDTTRFEAPDATVVRRRGDRLRRRTTALKAGGAALALGLTVTPLLTLTRHHQPGQPLPADQGLTAANALSVDDLPARPELGPWQPVRTHGPALACVPARVLNKLGATEALNRAYGVQRTDSSARGPDAAQVRETVLAFADAASAKAALATVTDRLRHHCTASDLANPDPVESQTITGLGTGLWEMYVRRADEVCTECDAIYFDRQAALRIDDRLVLVSLSELGGPVEPKGLKASMHQLTRTAAANVAQHDIAAMPE